MEVNTQVINKNRFLIKRSDLTTLKLFVEFYLPEYQDLLGKLRDGRYPLKPLKKISRRMFDGPFGSNRKVDMYQDEGVPFIRVKDVLPGRIEKSGLTYISEEKHEELSRSRVVPGNVLITIAGRLGTATVFPEDLVEGNITGHIAGIEPQANINPHYLALFLNSRFGEFQVTRWGHRTTRPELNLREVGSILVTVPPREVQDRIAQIMQDSYATRQAKLTQAQQLRAGIDEFVLNELNINLAELESHRIAVKSIRSIAGGRFDFEAVVTVEELDFNGIEPTALNQVVQRINDRVTPAETLSDEIINYIGLGNIESNTGQLTDFSPIPGSQILSSSPTFKQGDILYGRMRPYLNKAWIAEFDGICSGEAVVLRPDKNKVVAQFLHALLLSRLTLNQVIPLQSGTSLPRVSASDVLSIRLPISKNLDQQISIGNKIERIREKAKKLEINAANVVAEAKSRVERMILGEEA